MSTGVGIGIGIGPFGAKAPTGPSGAQYLDLPGTTNNYASTPDSAALSITGDIDIQALLAPNDWTPTAQNMPVSKQGGSYRTSIGTDGKISITVDGVKDYWSTVASGLTDGEANWIRWTLDVDNGAGGSVARIYTGGTGASPSWSQLGADITHTSTVSFTDNTSALIIGGRNTSQFMFAGKIYRLIIKSGIGGTTVFDFDPSVAQPGDTSLTESSSHAATVTLTGTAALV